MREEDPLLGEEEAQTRAVGYLRSGGGPHLHQFVASGQGGEAKPLLSVEVEFMDEMESCFLSGGVL